METSLVDIGIEKVQLWIQLRDVYDNTAFEKFHEALSESMMLIDWLREVMHGMDKIMLCNSLYYI